MTSILCSMKGNSWKLHKIRMQKAGSEVLHNELV